MPGFEHAGGRQDTATRILKLRARITRFGFSAFLIPRTDAHRGEQVADCDNRLGWATGFSGSAGLCVVATDRAVLFVDGRYTLQASIEVEGSTFEVSDLRHGSIVGWFKENVHSGSEVGFDPWLHTKSEIGRLEQSLAESGIRLRPAHNLVDDVWDDRPDPPRSRVFGYPESLSGESSVSKRSRMAEVTRSAGADAAVMTLPDSIAWLMNIRGSDLRGSPVALSFAIMDSKGDTTVYLELPRQFSDDVGPALNVRPKNDFVRDLAKAGETILVDPDTAPVMVFDHLRKLGRSVVEQPDPCILAKSTKNPTEISGSETAHFRDGAAVAEFLAWLDCQVCERDVTELEVASALADFRARTGELRDLSFSTIAASGPNAAIVHYSASPESNRKLEMGELLLIDSGGQYLDGTTDVTRTIAIGEPDGEHCVCFTRVLKGLIALARARWPKGRAGRHLDALARYHLWLAGQDFDHGTGHGVGQFLNVHEGPQRLAHNSGCEFLPGMILSIEPGYYRSGKFGIRIENLAVVEPACLVDGGDDREMLEFRNLTWVPIDRKLIVLEMLTSEERRWIDDYHGTTLEKIRSGCSTRAVSWLTRACAPLG